MASIITEFKICFKSLEDYTLINDVDHHDRATELAALQTHLPKQFEAILELVTIKATAPGILNAEAAFRNFIRGMQTSWWIASNFLYPFHLSLLSLH